jgi:hypothetical protein
VARKGAKRPIFEGNMPPKKMYPQYWRYRRHNRNPVKELESKCMEDHSSYKKLIDWRAESATILLSGGKYDAAKIADGIDVINDKYKAYVFVKRSGFKYENFRIDLKNDFDSGKDTFPDNIVEASRRLDNWRPMFVPKDVKKAEKALQFHQSADANGEQHYEQADKSGIVCFNCERTGHFTKECTNDKKANGSSLNDQERIQKMYDEKAVAKAAMFKARNKASKE